MLELSALDVFLLEVEPHWREAIADLEARPAARADARRVCLHGAIARIGHRRRAPRARVALVAVDLLEIRRKRQLERGCRFPERRRLVLLFLRLVFALSRSVGGD